MTEGGVSCAISIHVSWWVRWYIEGVSLMSAMTGLPPDMDKVTRTVMRGVHCRVGKRDV